MLPQNSPNHHENTELLSRIATDEHVFEEIVRTYEKPLYNHLIRLTGNVDEAGDLLQKTFIRLYNWRDRIEKDGNLKNWLYKVSTNLAYDFFRKKKRENLAPLNDQADDETIYPELTYSSLEHDISVIDLENALREIEPHYKNILLLYYREGFSYEEIAHLLEIPLNTVKTHIRRAKQALAALLNETYGTN